MLVLGFDTAASACSAALSDDGKIIARRFEAMARGQAEHLMGMIADVMEEAGKAYQDLDLLAVTTGPGSFTGLRIGLAAARGLALAGDLACMGVTTLEVVAAGVQASERDGATLLVAIESKRDDIFVQVFAAGLAPLSPPQAVLPDALAAVLAGVSITGGRVVIAGDAGPRAVAALDGAGLEVALSNAPEAPDAGTLAALAASRWSPETPIERPRPLYLRPPDAKVPKDGGRLRP
ncbi:MAG: tRNA (adenosine(37)-N6)-threonylcarbamoyltransferase complex dimerization subunit type 1 TsaB [Proteobacteria bacterium]|nr:tRNA (adenosine(37)-N6)-threonylcarbamoyltransferase complex dimerization subunit type 1 TsaB [Pseudomonadota bacterium]